MKALSRLKQFEKKLNIYNQERINIWLNPVGYKDAGVEPGTPLEEKKRVMSLKYPLRQRFLDSENGIEILERYLKSNTMALGRINVIVCEIETVNIMNMDLDIPYSELASFFDSKPVAKEKCESYANENQK